MTDKARIEDLTKVRDQLMSDNAQLEDKLGAANIRINELESLHEADLGKAQKDMSQLKEINETLYKRVDEARAELQTALGVIQSLDRHLRQALYVTGPDAEPKTPFQEAITSGFRLSVQTDNRLISDSTSPTGFSYNGKPVKGIGLKKNWQLAWETTRNLPKIPYEVGMLVTFMDDKKIYRIADESGKLEEIS